VACHLGTLIAIIVYFRDDLLHMAAALPRVLTPARRSEPAARLAWLVILGTLPVVVVGLALRNAEDALRTPAIAATTLALGGALVEITSPDPSVRWRIRGGGSVEHTTNGGTAWEAAPTGVDAVLTAGASPSPLVCWLIGRAGTVLLSTDGRTFRRVPFPEMTDLATVQATDAQTATVTTTGGRTFRTTDGGGTWAPLQGL